MPDKKFPQTEFTDCLGCGKRIATRATVCHHCNTKRTPANQQSPGKSASTKRKVPAIDDAPDDECDSHFALSYGGYDEYDLEAESDDPKSNRKGLWFYVAWFLIVLFIAFALFPFFFYLQVVVNRIAI